jgi:hypothetical protein
MPKKGIGPRRKYARDHGHSFCTALFLVVSRAKRSKGKLTTDTFSSCSGYTPVNNTYAAPMSGAELRRRRLAVQRELAENESAWQRELDQEVEEKANTPINWSRCERLVFRSQEYDDDGTNCVTRNTLHFGDMRRRVCERQELEEQVAALEGRVEQLKLDHEKHVKAAKRKSNNDRKRLERIVSGELLTSADITRKKRDKKSLKSRAYADKQTAKANQTLARLMQIQTVMLASAALTATT